MKKFGNIKDSVNHSMTHPEVLIFWIVFIGLGVYGVISNAPWVVGQLTPIAIPPTPETHEPENFVAHPACTEHPLFELRESDKVVFASYVIYRVPSSNRYPDLELHDAEGPWTTHRWPEIVDGKEAIQYNRPDRGDFQAAWCGGDQFAIWTSATEPELEVIFARVILAHPKCYNGEAVNVAVGEQFEFGYSKVTRADEEGYYPPRFLLTTQEPNRQETSSAIQSETLEGDHIAWSFGGHQLGWCGSDKFAWIK